MYVNGVILAGTGLGAVVFSQFSYNYLNPTKIKPIEGYYMGTPATEELALKVPTLIRFLSLFYLSFGILATALMAPVMLHNRKILNDKLEKEKLER